MAGIDPYAFTNAFNQQVQLGQQRNAFAAQQKQQALENERAENALALQRKQLGMQEQRFGVEQQQAQQQIRQRALGNVAPLAVHALTIQDPLARKQYLKNSIPVFAEDFRALGSNIEQGLGQLDAMPDQQLEQMLSQVAQFAPRPSDEGALVAYIDPQTNQPVYGSRSQAIGKQPYDKPPSIIPQFTPVQTAGGVGAFDSRTGRVTQTGEQAPPKSGTSPEDKPLPVPALRMIQDSREALSVASGIDSALSGIEGQLRSGKLRLGPLANVISRGQNAAGASTENSRNFQLMTSTFEKMRNDSLRLNKGVQTEGDAQRAWNELFANLNDEKAVVAQLQRIRQINERGANLQRDNMAEVYRNFGRNPSGAEQQPAQGGWSVEVVQ